MRYRFANCELDERSHTLRVDGEERHVEPQVFDLLALLVRSPGELVSRDRLVEAIWGGRIVSESAIAARINAARRAVGDDGTRQEIIATVPRRGVKLVAPVSASDEACEGEDAGSAVGEGAEARQSVGFCRSTDGTSIAWARSGSGPLVVRAGHWLTHLEHDWSSPIWAPFFRALGRRICLLRYDQRGNGLSDRDVARFDLDAHVADLEAVVDAAGADRICLYGCSQGAPIAIAFAARHPHRVRRLILHGGYLRGRRLRGEVGRAEA